FIIGHMGLFFYNQKGSIISIEDLPTTEIIEPFYNLSPTKDRFFFIMKI
ncbi:DNA polymerase IV, partial [Streptococcus thermophilus]|nr:DNA polymerase IV [Streptococcus thermophilus]